MSTLFGSSEDGKTIIIQRENSKRIHKILIENKQFAPNDFPAALYRIGSVNEIKNSDIQKGIHEMFNSTKEN